MQNLDQIRATAAHALCKKANFSRADVAGFPGVIMNNGLLSATAFATEAGRESRSGIAAAIDGLARHLANPALGIDSLQGIQSTADLLKALSEKASSLDLQRTTTEALAFFSYVKRFAPRKNN
jgi:CRISPR/Cas system CMR-associated protein Cmr5 small subunit